MFLILLNFLFVFAIKLDYEYTCRIASFFHAVISSLYGFLYINEMISYNVLLYSIKYSIVYLLTDLYLYYSRKISSKDIVEMTIHHTVFLLIALLSYTEPLYYSYGIISETSTIFLNLRWFAIKNFIVKDIKLYSFLLWITFLIFRIINLTYLAYKMIYSIHIYYTILILPFLFLNAIWFIDLTKNGINRYIKQN